MGYNDDDDDDDRGHVVDGNRFDALLAVSTLMFRLLNERETQNCNSGERRYDGGKVSVRLWRPTSGNKLVGY